MQEAEVEDLYEGLPNASLPTAMLAGALAGISEHTVMYPVDAIKTRMQVYDTSVVYRNMSSAISKITATEGATRLWRGIMSVVMGAGPAHAVHFGTYEFVKAHLSSRKTFNEPITNAIAGASATIAGDGFMNPFDVVKQRLQVRNASTKTVFQTFSHIYRTEGLAALWISYPTTLTMTVPFTAVQFMTYEEMKKVLNPTNVYSPMTHIVSGGVAGALGAAVTNPLDVCKTLLQTRGTSSLSEVRQANGLRDAFRVIKQLEGWKGFTRGLVPRLWVNAPSTAICWLSYEGFKQLLGSSTQ